MSMKTKITRMKNISRSRLLSMCNLHKYYANHLSTYTFSPASHIHTIVQCMLCRTKGAFMKLVIMMIESFYLHSTFWVRDLLREESLSWCMQSFITKSLSSSRNSLLELIIQRNKFVIWIISSPNNDDEYIFQGIELFE